MQVRCYTVLVLTPDFEVTPSPWCALKASGLQPAWDLTRAPGTRWGGKEQITVWNVYSAWNRIRPGSLPCEDAEGTEGQRFLHSV